jgi:hypothetical protein
MTAPESRDLVVSSLPEKGVVASRLPNKAAAEAKPAIDNAWQRDAHGRPHQLSELRNAVSQLSKMLANTTLQIDSTMGWARDFQSDATALKKLVEQWDITQLIGSTDFERWLRLMGRDTATRRALAVLHELKGQGLVESGAFDRATMLIGVLFTPNTIYATVAPDDGGVTFYWRAGDMSIGIDIYAGEGYWWRVRNVAAENYSGSGYELPIEQLKHSLTWFSKQCR